MPKSNNRPVAVIVVLVVIAAAFGAYAWHRHRRSAETTPNAAIVPTKTPPTPVETGIAVDADHIDPANEGRLVTLVGELKVQGRPATDTQLGISADAVMLLRFAEMLQWQERRTGDTYTYAQVWSPQVIDSKKFHVPDGHQNPARMPISVARFSAGGVRLGAFALDAAVLGNYRLDASLQAKPVAYPVTAAQLPSNIAVTFRDANGALYTGDPEHRAVGDVRVSYRIIPAGKIEVTGVQRGDRLILRKSAAVSPPS